MLSGTKRSRQRDRIYAILRKTRSHPTAEWVFEKVRETMPRVSLGTVYRNLHVLREQRKIQELDFGEGIKRYDAFMGPHYHFFCEDCGTVRDLEVPPLSDVNDRVQQLVTGTIRTHRLDFVGLCEECASQAS